MDFIQQFHWRPDIGDPTPMGWITTAAYALATIASLAAARRAGCAPGLPVGSRFIWMMVMALMACLGFNKQLDLQSLLNESGRMIASKLGMYEQRREFQKWFMIGLLSVSSLGALSTLVFFRGFWKQHLTLISGLFLILTYVALRAAAFEHITPEIGRHLENPRTRGLLETGGIALVLIAALIDWRNPSKAVKPPWKPAENQDSAC
jgi:hypothetical protein